MRTKTYSADTGYVYQYVYRGYREFFQEESGKEYVFSATRDRRHHFSITVRLLEREIVDCGRRAGRELLHAEHYALVKMTLFEALDEVSDMQQFALPLTPDALALERHLHALGRI